MTSVQHIGTHPKTCDHMILHDAAVSATQLEEKEKNEINQLQTS